MRLFTGSWGSLGLITELTLRTFPRPPQRRGLLLQGDLSALESLRRQALAAELLPQRLDWWSPALAGEQSGEQPALLLSLVSVSAEAIGAQLTQHRRAAESAGLRAELLDPEQLQVLESAGRGGAGSAGAEGQWLLQLGVLPARGTELLADPALHGLRLSLAAGAGQGIAWGAAKEIPSYRVERLRHRCEALGGFLTVLQQPQSSALVAWGDSPARALIEAIKREFDPQQQLARGRLPGVAPQPGMRV
jgi:glycolate oxidase FAD binding subunit